MIKITRYYDFKAGDFAMADFSGCYKYLRVSTMKYIKTAVASKQIVLEDLEVYSPVLYYL